MTTPKLRVSLMENFYLQETDHRLPVDGDVGNIPVDANHINDRLVVSHLDGLGTDPYIVSYDANGSTVLNKVRLFGSNSTKFIKEDDILYAFTLRGTGTSMFSRRGTTDGENWFGETHWSISGVSVSDFAPVSPTRMYLLTNRSGVGSTNDYKMMNIRVVKHTSGSWGATQVYDVSDVYNIPNSDYGQELVAKRIKDRDKDVVIYKYSSSISAIEGIKGLVLDGIPTNSHGEFSIIDTVKNPGTTALSPLRGIVMSNIAEGNSAYYIAIRIRMSNFGVKIGSSFDPLYGALYWSKSKDLINWSAPIPFGTSSGYVTGAGIVSGLTDGIEFTSLGVSVLQEDQYLTKHILSEANEIDISDDIVAYQNTNNENISLVVNNSK